MEEIKERQDDSKCTSPDKETDTLYQLECCKIYFQHTANNTTLTREITEFYGKLRILIGILKKLPPEVGWSTREIAQDICFSLICTICSCSLPIDGQLLCSTAFCSVVRAALNTSDVKVLLHSYLNSEKCIHLAFELRSLEISVKDVNVFKIGLCHGLLQSSEVSDILHFSKEVESGNSLIFIVFNLLEEACMKYSRLTSLAFKVLVLWVNKVCLQLKCNITSNILRRIFSVINSNWESPFSGIKEQNTKLLYLFLDVCTISSANGMDWNDRDTVFRSVTNLLHHVMEEQPWKMKSKYFMLSTLLPRYGVKKAFADFPDLVHGLILSLSFNHLVSAGSDVYRSCIKNMSVDDWISIFMTPVIAILTDGTDTISSEKQNLLNYWISNTHKEFPSFLNNLLDQLIDISQSSQWENTMFSVISLLKLGRKKGSFLNIWNENSSIGSFKFVNFLNLINSALQHSNEAIRAEAFAIVCTSCKTHVVPSFREFELVQIFLLENVNADNAPLRQTILNSFSVFLIRLRDSSLHALKTKENEEKSKQCVKNIQDSFSNAIGNISQFLDRLYHFLISNLEPGTNYQRKILSLQLYKLVLSHFNEPSHKTKSYSGLRRKDMIQDGKKFMSYAVEIGQWHFSSERSHKILLHCVLDSTDDVRETAGSILTEFFGFKDPESDENKSLLNYASQLCTSSLFYETESGALLVKILGNWTYKIPCKNSDNLILSMLSQKCDELETKRNSGNSEILSSQQKLLNGLYNKSRNSSYKQPEQCENIEVDLKKKVATFEGMVVMDPSELECIGNTELPESSRIIEGMAVMSKDGSVGQRIATFVSDEPHSVPNETTDSGADVLNNSVSIDEKAFSHSNVEEETEVRPDQRDSNFNLKNEERAPFVGQSYASAQQHRSLPSTSYSRNAHYFFLDDDNEIQVKSVPEGNENVQNVFKREIDNSKNGWPKLLREKENLKYRRDKQNETMSPKIQNSESLHVNESDNEEMPNDLSMKKSRHFKSVLTPVPQCLPHSLIDDAKTNGSQSCSASSFSGFESPNFQHSVHSETFTNTDTESPHLNVKSQNKNLISGIDSEQKRHFRSHDVHMTLTTNALSDDFLWWLPEHQSLNNRYERATNDNLEANVETCVYSPEDNLKNLEPENVDGMYNGLAPLSIYLLTQAEIQLTSLKEDILLAASSGAPLHGTITALTRIATQPDGPEFECMTLQEMDRTVTLLEQAVCFLLELLSTKSNSITDVAPSFAEMDEAIKSSIQQSVSDFVSVDEEMQLSPAHQLVLNCVWLNLKACCNLASGLSCKRHSSITVMKRCGRIITQVLTRCRHKGAIESAGVAMSTFVKAVTSQSVESNETTENGMQLALRQMLTEFLDTLVCGGGTASVTRRSAGLSILIHRTVASDLHTGKPLLHMCVSRLLEIARTSVSHEVSCAPKSVLMDLPQAQALHFLRILVQDSSLRQEMAQYMSSVTLICFTNFSSPLWTIRNAALQLSGALIPKLVGQKKIQDEEATLGSGVSVEEFFSHFPELTDFMLVSIHNAAHCHPSQALQQHANLIPMLSLLAKVSVGSEAFINISLVEKINQYRACFLELTSSPIYHIRKLAAKAYERFLPLTSTHLTVMTFIGKLQIHDEDCVETHTSCPGFEENSLNGTLLILKYLIEKLKHDSENIPELKYKITDVNTLLRRTVSNCTTWNSYTYFNRALLLELVEDEMCTPEAACVSADETIENILDVCYILEKEQLKNSFKPGLFLWAAKVIEVAVMKCFPHDVVTTWYNSYTLCSNCPDIVKSSFASLKRRIQNDEKIDGGIRASLLISLLKICLEVAEDCQIYTLFPLLDIMLVLIEDVKLNVAVTFREVQEISYWCLNDRRNKSEYSMIALPVAAGLLSRYYALGRTNLDTPTLELIPKLAACIKTRSDATKYEEDFRLNAARALHLLGPIIHAMFAAIEDLETASTKEILKNAIEILLDSELALLQDEDHEVRKEATKFVATCCIHRNDTSKPIMWNPYLSLRKLLEPSVLTNLLPVLDAMEFLWKKLHYSDELQEIKVKYSPSYNKNSGVTSPFDRVTSNIYSEEIKMVDVFGMSLIKLLEIATTKEKNELKNLINYRLTNYKDDISCVISLLKITEPYDVSLATSDNELCHIVAKKMLYYTEVMAVLGVKVNCDIEIVIMELQQLLNFAKNEHSFHGRYDDAHSFLNSPYTTTSSIH